MDTRPSVCQFCEASTDIRFKCDDCTLLLCTPCNVKIHSKIPSVVEHTVTEIQSDTVNTTEQNARFDLKQVSCANHHEQTCFAVCQNCDKSICSSCIVTSDNQEMMNKIYTDKLESLKEIRKKIEEDLAYFTENANNLWEMKEERLEEYNKIKREILNKEEEMKDKIAELAFSLVKQLDAWWSPQNNEISKEQELMKDAEKDLKQRINIIDNALQSQKRESVMKAADLVIKELPQKVIKEISTPNKIKFSTKNATTDFVVGILLEIPTLEIVQSYDCDVTDHLIILDKHVMIGLSDNSREMKHFVKSSIHDCYYTKSKTDISIWDTTLTSKKNVLLTKRVQMHIYKIKENSNDVEVYHNINPLRPLGIHACRDGSVIVGYKDNVGTFLPPDENSRRGIVILNENNTQIESFDDIDYGGRLFHLPHIITTNINDDICLIDAQEKSLVGRVITLERHGKLKWIYEGNSVINSEKKFTPRGITTTSEGEIFISDYSGGSIHMLSMDGDFITSIGTLEGIDHPIGLTSNEEDEIFVGCAGELHILEASFNQPSNIEPEEFDTQLAALNIDESIAEEDTNSS